MWVFSILMALSVVFASDKMSFAVKGMVCSFCAQGIEKKFKSFKEIKTVSVDLDTKKVSLEFNPGQALTLPVIEKVIKDAGYEMLPEKQQGK